MRSLLPPVRATLQERYLFNFRMPPAVFKRLVPVPWLQPQLVHGQAIISFCTLQLRNITVAPLPTIAGLSSLSCAYRFAALDHSQARPAPAVYVPARYTSSGFGSWFTHLGFSAPHPHIHGSVTSGAGGRTISIRLASGEPLFSATIAPAASAASALFETADAFAAFIRAGVTSYGDSVRGAQLTVMDLHKTESRFEPLAVRACQAPLFDPYAADGVALDSAFFTAGGRYEWTYHGLTPSAKGAMSQAPAAR